ncbi:hypothetical protein D3C81_315430 [compost metagenome]
MLGELVDSEGGTDARATDDQVGRDRDVAIGGRRTDLRGLGMTGGGAAAQDEQQ